MTLNGPELEPWTLADAGTERRRQRRQQQSGDSGLTQQTPLTDSNRRPLLTIAAYRHGAFTEPSGRNRWQKGDGPS
jgi:hypothetical protein